MKRTMQHLSYGIERPCDLLKKLEWEADKLRNKPHAYDVFNFMLTAAVLAEWIQKFYSSDSVPDPFAEPKKGQCNWLIPSKAVHWINDTSCLPNPYLDVRYHIENALSICSHTANASKHFHWKDGRSITRIEEEPQIGDYYQYFFTSTAPDLYLEFEGDYYGLQQIKGILLQFYTGLIHYLENKESSSGAVS
ncbi:MAG: hypothetical protein A4S08_10245 [Proteobacteria bacterium SG_bin4]|nr:MAG: hypothetical protein A4S08_10245 [Proteobacteria bacterium SG_bin4]